MSVFAQPFSAGIKAGVPLTDSLNASQNGIFEYNAPAQRYIIGGMAEVRLPLGFGVEFDALYRNLQYSSGAIAFNTVSASGSNWEFPLLLKYRFHFPVVRPYVEAGVAWDTITGLKETIDQVAASSPSELQKNTTMGFVLGGGVDIHAVFLHISPELRFTRWSSQQINAVQSTIDLLHSNLNQAEFLVGITF
jgi:opacity protein-like surface antigen